MIAPESKGPESSCSARSRSLAYLTTGLPVDVAEPPSSSPTWPCTLAPHSSNSTRHGGLVNTARWVVTVRRDSLLNNKPTTRHEFKTAEAAKAFVASMKE